MTSANIPEDMVEQAVRSMMKDKLLEVWIGIRDQKTGGLIYTFLIARDVRDGYTVKFEHKVGDFQVG